MSARPVLRYGPHREDGTPKTVTVLGPGKWPPEEQRPFPKALARQRRQLNELARTRG